MNAQTTYTPETKARYSVEYSCRDIGYGIEEGEDVFVYLGRESWPGKHIFEPTNGGPPIYLFDDEIVSLVRDSPLPERVWPDEDFWGAP